MRKNTSLIRCVVVMALGRWGGGEGGDAEAVGALGKVRRLEYPNGATHTSPG